MLLKSWIQRYFFAQHRRHDIPRRNEVVLRRLKRFFLLLLKSPQNPACISFSQTKEVWAWSCQNLMCTGHVFPVSKTVSSLQGISAGIQLLFGRIWLSGGKNLLWFWSWEEWAKDRFPAGWCWLPAACSGSTAASAGAVHRLHIEDTWRSRGTFLTCCPFQCWTENYDQKIKFSRYIFRVAEELCWNAFILGSAHWAVAGNYLSFPGQQGDARQTETCLVQRQL